MTPDLPRCAIIGAGSSGIAAAKALHEHGIDFDCFEASDRVGGNWVFGNSNGMSSAYRVAAHQHLARADGVLATSRCRSPIRTSRTTRRSRAYFDDYVDHFGFRDRDPLRDAASSTPSAARDGVWDARRSTTARSRATTRCSSPTATTGTRAGPSRRSPAPTPSPASRCTRTTTVDDRSVLRDKRRRRARAWATARWTSPSRRRYVAARDVPRRPPRRVDRAQVRLRPADRPAAPTTRASRSRSAQRIMRG